MKATCKTCGGTVPNHVPSALDPQGIGNPGHAMPGATQQPSTHDGAELTREVRSQPAPQEVEEILLSHGVDVHYNNGPQLGATGKEILTAIQALIAEARIDELDAIQRWNLRNGTDYGTLGNLVRGLDLENHIYERMSHLPNVQGDSNETH